MTPVPLSPVQELLWDVASDPYLRLGDGTTIELMAIISG